MSFLKVINEQMVRRTVVLITVGVILSALVFSSVGASQDPDARPRTTQTTAPKPTPSPTGPIVPKQTAPAQPTPTPTPNQTPKPAGVDRIAPTLGEPPPPPKLKPTPTPTPPPVIEEGDILKFNAELVQLHVRVIDRNNRPIDNVPQNEFH